MLVDVAGLIVGVVFGALTGLWFERRATAEAKVANAELEDQLGRLRSTVLSLGGTTDTLNSQSRGSSSIDEEILKRAFATQDAGGRVRKSELTTYLVEYGHSRPDASNALERLVESGLAREDGSWIRLA